MNELRNNFLKSFIPPLSTLTFRVSGKGIKLLNFERIFNNLPLSSLDFKLLNSAVLEMENFTNRNAS